MGLYYRDPEVGLVHIWPDGNYGPKITFGTKPVTAFDLEPLDTSAPGQII